MPKRLHRRRKQSASANRWYQSCGLDKLGVTGSSPVPPILASGLVEPFRVILAVLCAIFVQLLLDEFLQTIRVRALLAFVQVPIDPEEESAAVGLFKPLCSCGRVVPG